MVKRKNATGRIFSRQKGIYHLWLQRKGEKMKLTKKEIDMIGEAFMRGRIYARLGEKENPHDEFDLLLKKCLIIKKQTEEYKEWV